MKKKNAGDVTAKKQRKKVAAKARRARRAAKFKEALLRKIKPLVIRIGQLEQQVKLLQPKPAAAGEETT
jgi:predicted FMN-binding regulatory protein PaiB